MNMIALLLCMGLFFMVFVVVAVVLLALLLRRDHHKSALPPRRVDEPLPEERVERISREIEKINAMAAAGRISDEEASELKQALEGQRREWTEGCAEFARQSGAVCSEYARKPLVKSRNQVLAGVCGGLAEWFGFDATLVRLIYALLVFFSLGFPGVILYVVLSIIMPAPDAVPPSLPVQPLPGSPIRKEKNGKGLVVVMLCLLAIVVGIVIMLAMCFVVKRSAVVDKQERIIQMHQSESMHQFITPVATPARPAPPAPPARPAVQVETP